jgi:hypothetical protein
MMISFAAKTIVFRETSAVSLVGVPRDAEAARILWFALL